MNEDVITGTVLGMKMHPTDEISVKLHGRPVVISLRNVKISTPGEAQPVHRHGNYTNIRNMRDICEGMSLVLDEIGVWNVNTTAFHGGNMRLAVDVGSDTNRSEVVEVNRGEATGPSSSVLPQRRKHAAMSSR
jgi:hypothetical protein